jgi:hypothetical protein
MGKITEDDILKYRLIDFFKGNMIVKQYDYLYNSFKKLEDKYIDTSDYIHMNCILQSMYVLDTKKHRLDKLKSLDDIRNRIKVIKNMNIIQDYLNVFEQG